MNNSFYFQHDYHSRNDPKVLMLRAKYGAEGYGVFWMLVEIMAESADPQINFNSLPAVAVAMNMAPQIVQEIIDYCIDTCKLFVTDGEVFTSLRITAHRKMREDFSQAGKRGAEIRWPHKNRGAIHPPIHPPIHPCNAKDRIVKDRIVKKNNVAFSFEEVYNKYPSKIGRRAAEAHFEANIKTKEDFDLINKALDNYLKSDRVAKGFIQNASTWFNNYKDWIEMPQQGDGMPESMKKFIKKER